MRPEVHTICTACCVAGSWARRARTRSFLATLNPDRGLSPALRPPRPPVKPPSPLLQRAAAPLNPALPRPHPSVFSPFYFFMNEKRSGRSQANRGAPIGRLRPRPLSRSQWCSAAGRVGGRGATVQPIRWRRRRNGGSPLAGAEGKQAARGGARWRPLVRGLWVGAERQRGAWARRGAAPSLAPLPACLAAAEAAAPRPGTWGPGSGSAARPGPGPGAGAVFMNGAGRAV